MLMPIQILSGCGYGSIPDRPWIRIRQDDADPARSGSISTTLDVKLATSGNFLKFFCPNQNGLCGFFIKWNDIFQ
jgi:hypothetical protein